MVRLKPIWIYAALSLAPLLIYAQVLSFDFVNFDDPDYVSNPNAHAPHSQLQWFNTAAFTVVPAGQYRPGNSSNGSIIGPGYENWDLSLFKNAHFGAERDLQFRFETFNAFNHTNFNAISTVTSATNYGQVTSAGSARVLQLGAKFAF